MRARKLAAGTLAAMILLSGCSWMDGSYVSVTPHQVGLSQTGEGDALAVTNIAELRSALVRFIDEGRTGGLFSLAGYPREEVPSDMEQAVKYALESYPIGAYAVEDIKYEFGTGLGASAMSVRITYRHSPEELAQIRTVRWMSGAAEAIGEALDRCDDRLVLQISGYEPTDFDRIVRSYAQARPDRVMEIPQVQAAVYPDSGNVRVVELNFSYQTDREVLLDMREEVQPVFSSAALYVSGQAAQWIKFSQLHSFLTERFEYKIETSVTPAYSLLCRGVGDSKAFSQVYTTMCKRIGLEAQSINGTRNGGDWWWNLVNIDGVWYHLDLLGNWYFAPLLDAEMTEYDWDRAAYPAADGTAE